MRKVERFGIYNRPPHKGEINSGEQVTDPGGYVDQNKRVLQFIAAGQKLKASRREMFDVQQGEEPDFSTMDPTRSPAYDHTDAAIDAAIIADRLAEQKRRAGQNNDPDTTSGELASKPDEKTNGTPAASVEQTELNES